MRDRENNPSSSVGPWAPRPQVSAKRENELVAASEGLSTCRAFAGGTPAVPEKSEWHRCLRPALRRARYNRRVEDQLAFAEPALVTAGKFFSFIQCDLETRFFRTAGKGSLPGVDTRIAGWFLSHHLIAGRTDFRLNVQF